MIGKKRNMNEKFIADRITQLRMKKGISEHQMGYDLGHSKSYFNNISRGRNLLSMSAFVELCDYFEITPAEFFMPILENFSEKTLHKYLKLNEENRRIINETIDAYLAKQTLEELDQATEIKPTSKDHFSASMS